MRFRSPVNMGLPQGAWITRGQCASFATAPEAVKLRSIPEEQLIPPRVFQAKDQIKSLYNKVSPVRDLPSEHSNAPMHRTGFKLLTAKAGFSCVGRLGTKLITHSNPLGEEPVKNRSAKTTG
jgi:hypothetical protein